MNTIRLNTIGTPCKAGGNSGGEGGGSASSVEYLNFTGDEGYTYDELAVALLECKVHLEELSVIAPAITVKQLQEIMDGGNLIHQAKVDFNTLIVMEQGGVVTKKTALEMLLSSGITQDQLDAIPRITEEEFYNIQF